MNGRLYDPILGRMLSPDNYIQAPDFSQNFNRYSYVLNNPLKYVDPDGEWLHIAIGAAFGMYQGYQIGLENGAEGSEMFSYICPGTSMAGAATFKIDAMVFLGGVVIGVAVFGETVKYFLDFWTYSFLGRFTLPEWLNLSTGVVILIIVVVALLLFWATEWYEKKSLGIDPKAEPKSRYIGAGVLIAMALIVILIGDPTTGDYWGTVAAEEQPRLDNREVQIHPGELLALMHDTQKNLVMLDVRDQRDYNQFHIRAAHQLDPTLDAVETAATDDLDDLNARTVVVTMSNGEEDATEAWKTLVANDVINVYILEGGINEWLEIFGEDADPKPVAYPNQLAFTFTEAIGGRCVASDPNAHEFELVYEPKVKIAAAGAVVGGGCG